MRNLLAMCLVLLLGEVALSNGLHAVRARVASRLLQVQQLGVLSHWAQIQATSKAAPLSLLLIVMATEADKNMPDQEARRSNSESPDDPLNGRPEWDKPRRGGGSSVYNESNNNSNRAAHWDQPKRSAAYWDN